MLGFSGPPIRRFKTTRVTHNDRAPGRRLAPIRRAGPPGQTRRWESIGSDTRSSGHTHQGHPPHACGPSSQFCRSKTSPTIATRLNTVSLSSSSGQYRRRLRTGRIGKRLNLFSIDDAQATAEWSARSPWARTAKPSRSAEAGRPGGGPARKETVAKARNVTSLRARVVLLRESPVARQTARCVRCFEVVGNAAFCRALRWAFRTASRVFAGCRTGQRHLAHVALTKFPTLRFNVGGTAFYLKRNTAVFHNRPSPSRKFTVPTPRPQLNLHNAREYFREHLWVGDDYFQGQVMSGEWLGVGAEKLALRGRVAEKEFLALCDGLHPADHG
jgi:TrwC relaxase